MACAQCASVPLIRLLMLWNMLACESRMVVHVTVCAIQSRILGSPSIKIKSLPDPFHVILLMLLLVVVILWNGNMVGLVECLDRGCWHLYRAHQCLAMELPALLGWDGQLGWLELNWLISPGSTSGTGPLRSVFALFPCPCILECLRCGLVVPSIECLNSLFPEWMLM